MNYKTASLIALLLAVLPAGAWARSAEPMQPVMMDADEVTAKLLKVTKDSPSAEAFYRLGRAYYVTGELKLAKIGVARDVNAKTGPDILLDWYQVGRLGRQHWGQADIAPGKDLELDDEGKPWAGGIALKAVPDQFIRQHMLDAMTSFRQAVALDSNNARAHLAFACALEDYAGETEHVDHSSGMTPFDARMQAMSEYRYAYDLTIKADIQMTTLPYAGLHSIVSYEAAKGYVRMVPLVSPNVNPPKLKELEEFNKEIAAFEKLSAAQTK